MHSPLHTILAILLWISLPVSVHAFQQADPVQEAHQQLALRQEVYFSFSLPGPVLPDSLGRVLSIDRIEEGRVYAYAHAAGFRAFLGYRLPFRVEVAPGLSADGLLMKDSGQLGSRAGRQEGWDFYPTYGAYVDMMHGFARDYPGLCSVVSVGTTHLGRELLFARITAPGLDPGSVPRVMLTSTIHGDETAGFVLSLRLINHLLEGFGRDPGLTELLQGVELWICPNENPDGTYRDDDNSLQGATRGNWQGYDLNRNYPNPLVQPLDPLQPETMAMMAFTDTMQFVLSTNMHGGIELVNYPFDTWTSDQNRHADHLWWQQVMQQYVDTAQYYSPPGYMTGLGTGLTHGGDWYVVYGSRQDFMNYYRRCREFTLELSHQKLPPASALPQLWENNRRSLLHYIRQAAFGIAGRVTDFYGGAPLKALIRIPGYDKDNSEVASGKEGGHFWRPLLQGTYGLWVLSDGYPVHAWTGMQVFDQQRLWLDAGLGRARFDPAELDFDTVSTGSVAARSLIIHNPGSVPLEMFITSIQGDDGFGYAPPAKQSVLHIPPGGRHTVDGLTFSPASEGTFRAMMGFGFSDDPLMEVLIPLRAVGAGSATAVAAVQPTGDRIKIYPNPMADRLVLEARLAGSGFIRAALFDVNGILLEVMAEAWAGPGDWQADLGPRFSGYPAGLYLLRVATPEGVQVLRLLKVR
jgi:hypothetical protein